MILGRGVLSVGVVLMTTFVIAAQIIPSKVLIELARAVHVSIVLAVIVSYGRVAWSAVRKGNHLNSGEILGLAIFLSFAGHFLFGWWMLFWRLSGQPGWIINSDVTGFIVALSSLAGLFYLAAPGAIDGHVPPKNRVIIGAAFGVGFLMFALIFLYSVDLSALAEALRPYVEDDDGSSLYGRARAFGLPLP